MGKRIFGGFEYEHIETDESNILIRQDSGIKIKITFTKNKSKHEEALNALKEYLVNS